MGTHFRERHDFVRITEITPAMRRRIEEVIDLLVDILNQFDGDEDLEDGGDNEPYLGWADMQAQHPHQDPGDDREIENEHGGNITDEPHDGDEEFEPDYGWSAPRW